MRTSLGQRGFTLPELLVVVAVLAIGAIFSVIMLKPANYDLQELQSERRLLAADMVQLIAKYQIEHGTWPEGITQEQKTIGNGEGQLNLCPLLIPKYAEDLPIDYLAGTRTEGEGGELTDKPCNEENVSYDTGMRIMQSADGRHITLIIPKLSELDGIKITR